MFEDVDEGHADEEETIHYYYKREDRIARAPKIVQDYYDGKLKPLRGFQALYKNKANLFILLGLVFFVATIWIYTGINKTRNYCKIDNLEFELSAFSYGEDIYSSIKIYDKKAEEKSSPVKVDAEYFFINNSGKVEKNEKSTILYKAGEQYLRTKCTDYDIIRVDVIVNANGKEKELSSAIKK